jgi:hypothetical protein
MVSLPIQVKRRSTAGRDATTLIPRASSILLRPVRGAQADAILALVLEPVRAQPVGAMLREAAGLGMIVEAGRHAARLADEVHRVLMR